MATPPTLVNESEGTWSHTGTSETIAGVVTGAAANRALVVLAASADSPQTISSPTGGSLTYSLAQSNVLASNSNTYAWTAIPSTSQTFSLGLTGSANGAPWTANVLTFSGSDGIGASSKTNGTGGPSLAITTQAANSAICVIVADWNAASGTTRTWRTVNGNTPTAGNGQEKTYYTDGTNYTVYAAVYPDAGAAGLKTVGLSAPTGMKYTVIAVEIKGAAAGGSGVTIDATLTEAATLAVTASAVKPGASTVTASTSVTAAGATTKPADTSSVTTASAVAQAGSTKPLTTDTTVSGALTTAAATDKPTGSTASATTTIAASTAVDRSTTTAVSAAAVITATADIGSATQNVTASTSATASITASSAVGKPASTSTSGTASITAITGVSKPTAAAVVTSAQVTTAAMGVKPASASVSVAAELGAAGQAVKPTSTDMSATASITASAAIGSVDLSASAAVSSAASLTATALRQIPAAGSVDVLTSLLVFGAATRPAAAGVLVGAAATASLALAASSSASLTAAAAITAALTVSGEIDPEGAHLTSGPGSISWSAGEGSAVEWPNGPASTTWSSGEVSV